MVAELAALALPHAQLAFQVSPAEPGPYGADQIDLLFSAHPGSELRSLGKTASGGELSRVRLALEVVLAAGQTGGTLVFDEVDAGVGGRVAVEIGRRLARLARHSQVIVVTHLAQVAAFADRHYVVVKSDDGQVSTSGVQLVARDPAGRRAGPDDGRAGHLGVGAGARRRAGGAGRGVPQPQADPARRGGFTLRSAPGIAWQDVSEMRLPTLLRRRSAPVEIGGVARLDRRTKNLTKRLKPGEVAIIHHTDLDRVSAEALVETGVSAVVNAVPSVSGRYPNLGPGILMDAGIPLIDAVGEQVFSTIHEGDRLIVDGGRLLGPHGAVVAEGTLYTTEILDEQLAYAREGLSDQIEAFADNTMTYLREEKELLLEGVGVPEVRTPIDGRHVLIVVRGLRLPQ